MEDKEKLFDEFVKFAKRKFGVEIVKDNINGKEYTFEELFGNIFKDSIMISKEKYGSELQDAYDNGLQWGTEWGSKEMTEKFYNTIVYRILALNFETDNKNYDEGFFDAIKEVLRRIDNVAKEFEIETKE